MFTNTAYMNFSTTPRIICEPGISEKLHPYLTSLKITKLMVISDQGIVDAGILKACLEPLVNSDIKTFLYSKVAVDPPEVIIKEAVNFAKDNAIDGVIAIGGGSSMDTAKLVALLANTNQSIEDCYGIDLATGIRLPLILVPTTAGTGSEVTAISVVTTPSEEKKGVVSPLLYPDIAILDAKLTLNLPPSITAMTAIDAMVHAVEAYTSIHQKNPISDALAVEALKLLFNNIDTVINKPSDINARSAMLVGANMAGMAFANAPVAAVHALAYPLGGIFHIPHGHSNAVLLPSILKFNVESTFARDCYAELARVLLVDNDKFSQEDMADRNNAAKLFIEEIDTLVKRMPFKLTLSEMGITQNDIERLANDAMKVERLLKNNPREVSFDDARAIYSSIL